MTVEIINAKAEYFSSTMSSNSWGIVYLDNELFVSLYNSKTINVYDETTLLYKRSFTVSTATNMSIGTDGSDLFMWNSNKTAMLRLDKNNGSVLSTEPLVGFSSLNVTTSSSFYIDRELDIITISLYDSSSNNFAIYKYSDGTNLSTYSLGNLSTGKPSGSTIIKKGNVRHLLVTVYTQAVILMSSPFTNINEAKNLTFTQIFSKSEMSPSPNFVGCAYNPSLDKVYISTYNTTYIATFGIEGLKLNKTLILHDGEYKQWNPTFKLHSKENAIPNMTSNNTPSGLVESSTIFSSGYEPYRAFNDIVNKDSDDTWAIQGSSGWISYTFPNPICIGSYKITGHGSVNAVNPKDWKLEGSNNGVDWVVLDTRTNVTNWLPTTTRSLTFEFENKAKFKTYKLTILTNNGDTSTQISRLEMFEFTFNEANNWSTHQLSNIQTEGMDSLSPLLDRRVEELEPLPMTDKSEILPVGETGKVFSKTLDLKKYLDIRSMKVKVK